ncbi:hypothetical protein AB9F29_18600 [Falsihalocynthiibacter sp. S25ZX9]
MKTTLFSDAQIMGLLKHADLCTVSRTWNKQRLNGTHFTGDCLALLKRLY